jgi:hypothetical protein
MSSGQSSSIVVNRVSICSIKSNNGLAFDVERRRDAGFLTISRSYRAQLSHASLSTVAITDCLGTVGMDGRSALAHIVSTTGLGRPRQGSVHGW